MTKRNLLDHTLAELDALAKKAVAKAVSKLHAKSISTHHLGRDGELIETSPKGIQRVVLQRSKKPLAAA